jgi:hypothetical protein
MKQFSTISWTLGILLVLDIGIGALTRYPPAPVEISSLSSLQRYFNYGRSIESKVRWMTADSDQEASPLARSGWLVREMDRRDRPAEGRQTLVAFYGMSFSNRIGEQLEIVDERLSSRLSSGPGAAIGRSYADYLLDRGRHEARVVVLGILASSVPATGTVTHMTWNFEAPGSHFYPKFVMNGSELSRIEPPAHSLAEFRELLEDEASWQRLVDFIETHDPYFDRWAFRADPLDHSVIGRLLRRAYAQSSFRRESARYHDSDGFTDHEGSITVSRRIVEAFAERARDDGTLPVVLLFNDRGFADHLYQALHGRLDALDVPYVSSHEVIRPGELSKFEPDGHFQPEYDREIARRLAATILSRMPDRDHDRN